MIKQAQKLQFSLREIGELLQLRELADATCTDVYRSARVKLEDIEARITTLSSIRDRLSELLSVCPRQDEVSARECSFYAELANPSAIKSV